MSRTQAPNTTTQAASTVAGKGQASEPKNSFFDACGS